MISDIDSFDYVLGSKHEARGLDLEDSMKQNIQRIRLSTTRQVLEGSKDQSMRETRGQGDADDLFGRPSRFGVSISGYEHPCFQFPPRRASECFLLSDKILSRSVAKGHSLERAVFVKRKASVQVSRVPRKIIKAAEPQMSWNAWC
jgi:hypothetical protein